MQITETEYKRNNGLTVKQIAERVFKRLDNPYKLELIRMIISLYCEECCEALKNGEKINISGVGTLTPKPCVPNTSNLFGDTEKEYEPFMNVKYIMNSKLKKEMTEKFRNNIKTGFAGLSNHCICTPQQTSTLVNKGYINIDKECEDE